MLSITIYNRNSLIIAQFLTHSWIHHHYYYYIWYNKIYHTKIMRNILWIQLSLEEWLRDFCTSHCQEWDPFLVDSQALMSNMLMCMFICSIKVHNIYDIAMTMVFIEILYMIRYIIHNTQPVVLGLGIYTRPTLASHAQDPHQIMYTTTDFLTTDLLTVDLLSWVRS